jgi:hypothetical protein
VRLEYQDVRVGSISARRCEARAHVREHTLGEAARERSIRHSAAHSRPRSACYQCRSAPHTRAVSTISPLPPRRTVNVLAFDALTVITYESAAPEAVST